MSFGIASIKYFDIQNNVAVAAPITSMNLGVTDGNAYEVTYSIVRNYTNGLISGREDINYRFMLGTGSFNLIGMSNQAGGKYLYIFTAGGPNVNFNSTVCSSGIMRVTDPNNPIGTLDTTWNSGGVGFLTASTAIVNYTVQSDGKVILILLNGNTTTTYNGTTVQNVVRLNADGTLDTTFTTNVGVCTNSIGTIQKVFQQSDGKVIIIGSFTTWKGNSRISIVRLNTDGTEDTTFYTNLGTGFGAASILYGVCQPTSTTLAISGAITTFQGVAANRRLIVGLNLDGTINASFNTNFDAGYTYVSGAGYNLISYSSTQFILGGQFSTGMMRINSDGTLDTAFNTAIGSTFNAGANGGIAQTSSISVFPNGDIIAYGTFTSNIKIVSSTGIVDSTFSTGMTLASISGTLTTFFPSPDNKGVFVFGSINSFNGIAQAEVMAKISTVLQDLYLAQTITGGGAYNSDALMSGQPWQLLKTLTVGNTTTDIGVVVNIDTTGQFTYTSTNLTGTKITDRISWILNKL